MYLHSFLSVCSVYACTVATCIAQFRESQSVKSTLTFMAITSQGHLRAEHLEWSVPFQTESNNWVFSRLWRWLFFLFLTLIPFDQAHESDGLNSLIAALFFLSPFFPLSLGTISVLLALPLFTSLDFNNVQVWTMTREFIQENNEKTEKKNVCRTRRGNLPP